jgi:hypothetical protein
MRPASRMSAVLLAVPLLITGCSAAGSPAPSAVAPSAAVGAVAADPTGCRSSGGLPPGVHSAPTIDVDGDGRPDTAWIAAEPEADGGVPFGVTTAAGGTFSATIRSASPIARSVLVADVTGSGELIALASDGRQVLLYAVNRCSFVVVRNVQGRQYTFDLGFTGYGTGVGCIDVTGDGVRDLVGLRLLTAADGTPRSVERTVVTLRGPDARNGATGTVPVRSPAGAETARSVTCGDRTLTRDGVTSNP